MDQKPSEFEGHLSYSMQRLELMRGGGDKML